MNPTPRQTLEYRRPARARVWSRGSRSIAICTAFAAVFGSTLAAQDDTQILTLEEAVSLAQGNNPAFLTRSNDTGAAEWAVREAYAGFLPTVNTSAGAQYVAAGTQRFGIFTGDDIGAGSTDYFLSDYALRLNMQLSGRTFFATKRARAQRTAAYAGVEAARFTLSTDVTRQYLLTLRAQEGVRVAERQFQRAEENFELANARVTVGNAVATEGKQAEVERGRAEVAVLQAQNLLAAERLRLIEQLGTELEDDVELENTFDVRPVTQDRETLIVMAMDGHPQLNSLRASRSAAIAGLREARSDYMPTVSLSATWSGFTREIGDTNFLIGQARSGLDSQRDNCLFLNQVSSGLSSPLEGYPRDCSGLTLTPAMEADLLAGNRVFPLDFQRQPLSASLTISLPVFTGFQRQRQHEQASAAEEDAQFAERAEELRLRAEVATRHGDVQTTYRIAQIEQRNRAVAEEQLDLARERYRLGAAAFLELLEAESSMAEAERDYLAAVYNYHDALSALESAVGTQLRQ